MTRTPATSSESDRSVAERNPEACPVVEAVAEVGSPWRLVVLNELQDGERRFSELERSTGADARTLSRVLDDLESNGLVDRRVEDRPVATYYRTTEKGAALCPVLERLEAWAEEWVDGPEDHGGDGDTGSVDAGSTDRSGPAGSDAGSEE